MPQLAGTQLRGAQLHRFSCILRPPISQIMCALYMMKVKNSSKNICQFFNSMSNAPISRYPIERRRTRGGEATVSSIKGRLKYSMSIVTFQAFNPNVSR